MNVMLTIIAQTPGKPPPTPNPLNYLFFAFILAMVVFMLLSTRSQRKREKREREQMFSRLAKSDHVQTIGGVLGTVIAVKDKEVVLKVDESTNTKMTFLKTAVQQIISDDQSTEAGKK